MSHQHRSKLPSQLLQVVQQYEKAVIFRLGEIKNKKGAGPGLFTYLPCLDEMRIVDMRTISFDVAPQEVSLFWSIFTSLILTFRSSICIVHFLGFSSLLKVFCACFKFVVSPPQVKHKLPVPAQQILTKDSVTVTVDAVVYYRIRDAIMSVCNVDDVQKATKLLAQTTLRNMLGRSQVTC